MASIKEEKRMIARHWQYGEDKKKLVVLLKEVRILRERIEKYEKGRK